MKRIWPGRGNEIEAGPGAGEDVVEVEPGVYSVLRQSRVDEVHLIRTRDGYTAVVAGRSFDLEAVDPRDRRNSSSTGAGDGRQSIAAPMPGKIVRVLVAPGGAVKAGQGLLVVEAMKMQNELKSPKTGTVVEIRVAAGSTVVAGEILAVVE